MDLYVGALVQSVIDDPPGLKRGEYGTIVRILDSGDPYIRWEEFNSRRHDGYGDIHNGHGWFVGRRCVKLAKATDLGELPEDSDIKFLFGDDVI